MVIQKGEKLYGLVYADPDEVKKGGLTQQQLIEQMEQNRIELNKIVPVYARVSGIVLLPEEFEKTPKKSIKRYKYTNYPID